MNIICLNGPPRCGKDTVGSIIKRLLSKAPANNNVVMDKFAAPLDEVARVLLPPMGDYNEWREVRKEEQLMSFPTTMRKFLISISEDLVKPNLGSDYFGVMAARRVVEEQERNVRYKDDPIIYKTDTRIFTDSGFQNEFDAFKAYLAKHSPEVKIYLVQIHRDGCNFDNDSREWVKGGAIRLDNNGSKAGLYAAVIKLSGTITNP